MNIETTKSLQNTDSTRQTPSSCTNSQKDDVKFADELKELQSDAQKKEKPDDIKNVDDTNNDKQLKEESEKANSKNFQDEQENSDEEFLIENSNKPNEKNSADKNVDSALNGLHGVVDEINKLNRTNENEEKQLKQINNFVDDKHEEIGLIDNNMNIQEPKDKINLQMGANTSFAGDGQPFSDFVKPENTKKSLSMNEKELAEEKAIMSTMEENVAIANKNMAMAKTKTVENEHGIKKVDKSTNIIVDTIVSYDNVIMDKTDVDFFVKLVQDGEADVKGISHTQKSAAVSKTLADLLAKSMNENKPIRIDFDNDISVIIKINRNGKISADFLPSSQVAEAYLKENLPLLKQKFDDNNIEYEELNHRKQKQDDQDNRKKGRKDE